MKKVLITGSNGFLGRELVKQLKSNYEIVGFDLHPEDKSGYGIKYISGNMLDSKSFENKLFEIEAVIHLAGIMQPQVRAKAAKYEDNILGTQNLINACQKNNIKRFIFVSTNAVNYAQDGYALSKLESERAVEKSQLDYTIIRPTMIYGRQSKDFQKIEQMIKTWSVFFTIGQSGKSQPISVYDVALVIKKCLESEISFGKIYSIGGQDIFTLQKFYAVLAKHFLVHKPILILPVWLAQALAIFIERFLPQIDFNRERIKSWTSDISVDNSLAQKDLNWSPIDFNEGLKH